MAGKKRLLIVKKPKPKDKELKSLEQIQSENASAGCLKQAEGVAGWCTWFLQQGEMTVRDGLQEGNMESFPAATLANVHGESPTVSIAQRWGYLRERSQSADKPWRSLEGFIQERKVQST